MQRAVRRRERPVNRIRWTEMVKRRPESTGGKQVTGRELTQFKPGQSGNPKGRPQGSRNKLSEEFFRDLCRAWEIYGEAALHTTAMEHPVEFVRVVASLMPKETQATITKVNLDRISDEQLDAIIARGIQSGFGEEEAKEDPTILQ